MTAQLDKAGLSWLGIDTNARGPISLVADIRDPGLASRIPEGADALVHLAAISRDPDCRANPREAFDVNVGGTINLIEACRIRSVRQFIFASTEWVYGEVANDGTQHEDSALDASKLVSEYALTNSAVNGCWPLPFGEANSPPQPSFALGLSTARVPPTGPRSNPCITR